MWQSPGEWNISRTCRNSCWDVSLKEEDLLLLYPSCCLEDWCNRRRTMLARTTPYRWSSRKLDTAWVPDICSMVLPWMCAQSLQLCPTLWLHWPERTRLLCPWDFPGRILEWVAMPSSRGSFQATDGTCVSCTTGRSFTTEPPGKPSINSKLTTLRL